MITAAGASVRRARSPIYWAIAGAWGLAVAVEIAGGADRLHHDGLIEGGLPLWAALGLFLVAWQAMIVAMMLPSSLPLVRLFNVVSAPQPHAGRVRLAFLAGYAVVWTAFGAAAFLGDVAVHEATHRWAWLAERPWLIAGSALLVAGLFQFSDLKDRCLDECRHPGPYLMSRYRRGAGAAFRIGREHGLFCVGCCWALMLVGFAAGVANLWWMAALTAIMVYEKTGRGGERGVVPIGIGLLALGMLVLAHPAWLPAALFGTG